MKASDAITEVGLTMEESQNQRDARLEQLWKKLDYQSKGELDWKGLQRGLRKIDHPLKNADDLLKKMTKLVDANGDGKIQYEEFRTFMQATERQLYLLFKSIDRDNDGRLDKDELQIAFQHAGLAVPSRRLHAFFEDVDLNKDGYISFDEWRDFLLFMPNNPASTTLGAVFTFYSDVVVLNSEGDSVISDETLSGIGTKFNFLIEALFGSIIRLASPPDAPKSVRPPTDSPHSSSHSTIRLSQDDSQTHNAHSATESHQAGTASHHGHISAAMSTTVNRAVAHAHAPASRHAADVDESWELIPEMTEDDSEEEFGLMNYLPGLGYYMAGAAAGGISRTATAPLDRLKVYLLINTKSSTRAAVEAAQKGQPVAAVKNFNRSLTRAFSELYREGGLRGLWAGNGLNVIKIMPETAIRFGTYEAAKVALANLEGHGDSLHINPWSKFIAGGVAGMTAQLCVYPLDTLKFRLQSEYVRDGERGRTLLLRTWRKMWADGKTAPYRGVTMGLVGMFPYSALDMFTFEFLKERYVRFAAKRNGVHEEDFHPGALMTGFMGGFSGAFGATAVYPLNVLRTRLQTQGTTMHPARYTGIVDVARRTWQHEGLRGLYKGLTPNLLKVGPALSITWIVYEKAKILMNLH
ncbi:calcium dependent mitochondrial carrier protein [Apiospora aurea]|uniref:Mitochondrial thiamine pyrophosphate carrier 1 n=1 Tax=Apiospora aurea TaxID=335848 RepID=A0ABR1Q963_9PEZI